MKFTYLLFNTLLALSAILWLTGCDPYGGYQYRVTNNSDSAIYVQYNIHYNDTIFTETVAPKSKKQLQQFSTVNGLSDYGSEFLTQYFEKFSITIDTQRTRDLKKDYRLRSNWEYSQENISHLFLVKTGENVYTLDVGNEDVK